MAKCKTQFDYTLEQFLLEVKYREKVIRILERIINAIEKLDKRISELEEGKEKEKNG